MVELIQGDCIKVLPNLPRARLLLTDIPYGEINRDGRIRNMNKGVADVETFSLDEFIQAIDGKAEIYIIFCGMGQFSKLFNSFAEKQKRQEGTVRQLVYAKTNPSPINAEYVYMSGTENAVYFKERGTGKLNRPFAKNYFIFPIWKSDFHPTEKNHDLLRTLIQDNTNAGDLVIDCCMGGGSTGIVCVECERDFIGVELDANYFAVAERRIKEAVDLKEFEKRQIDLFDIMEKDGTT